MDARAISSIQTALLGFGTEKRRLL